MVDETIRAVIIGSDKVEAEPERVIIHVVEPMDWPIREFCWTLMYLLRLPGLRAVDGALLLVLGADSIMRFGQSLKLDVEDHWGFCEWLWPRG